MRKLLLLLTLFCQGKIGALPLSNPLEPTFYTDGILFHPVCDAPWNCYLTWLDDFHYRIGYYGDFIFNRYMKIDHHAISGTSGGTIQKTKINTNAGAFTVNFYEKIDLYLLMGQSHLFLSSNAFDFVTGGEGEFELETSTNFSWSLGFRASLFCFSNFYFGAEGQYFHTKPLVQRLTSFADGSLYPDFKFKYHEWQLGGGVSYPVGYFSPYIGVKWSRAIMDFDDATFSLPPTFALSELENAKQVGFCFGLSFLDAGKASITAEARFFDEKAFHIKGDIRF